MLRWVLDDLNIEEIEIQEIISDDLAKLLACANTHCYSQKLREEDIQDGYYTEEEMEEALDCILKVAKGEQSNIEIPSCRCVAHQNINKFKDRYEEEFCKLICIPSKMNKKYCHLTRQHHPVPWW